MEQTDFLLAIASAVTIAILTYTFWYFFKLRANRAKSTQSNLTDGDRPNKKNKRFREKRVSWQAGIVDSDQQEIHFSKTAKSLSSKDKKCEMSMKEKFYLFLEKGFCPELEKGVKDPLHQYYGGKKKSPTAEGEEVDVAKLFCPYLGADASEKPEGNKNAKIEELIRIAKEGGGPCPFMLDKSIDENTTDADECPFEFGLADDADSEEEADVPANHGANGECPSMKTRAEKNKNVEDAKQILKNFKEKKAHHPNLKESCEKVKATLSPEELKEEEKARHEQMAAIVKLLAAEEDNLSADDCSELRSQINLYSISDL